MYKIIAIDADNTLLDNNSRIPEKNKRALLRAQDMGVHIVIASGRGIVTLRHMADELCLRPECHHIITLNGAAVFDGHNKQIRGIRMENKLTQRILTKILPLDMPVFAYAETDVVYAQLSKRGEKDAFFKYYPYCLSTMVISDDFARDLPGDIYKMMLLGENRVLSNVEIWMERERDEGGMDFGMFFSSPTLLEFTSKDSDKGRGLEFLCTRLGFSINTESIAIGDSFNDIGMLRDAALGVCMKNGRDEIKLHADYVTENTNHECGVAEVLERFVFIK